MKTLIKSAQFILIIVLSISGNLVFSQKQGNETYTYNELIAEYQNLAKLNPEIELFNMGSSDYGLPIYLCIINGSGDSLKSFVKAREKTTVLINNGIHPGEPDGINACVNWIYDWIKKGKPEIPVVAIIPAYNVGGMMNRSSTSRANQNGPEEYGFRGNANNLDLNRDFMKMDSKNAFTFAKIFHALDPDIFVDTHVSNGADYSYTLTLISSLKERLPESLRTFTYQKMIPEVAPALKKKNWDYMQYVELKGETPEEGLVGFNDLPRYANGYASLFNSLSFTIETHMLKPFPERVKATQDCLEEMILFATKYSSEIENARENAKKEMLSAKTYPFKYELSDQADSISFKGYESGHKPSLISKKDRLYYDRSKPYEKLIPNFNTFVARDTILIPAYYVVGAQCTELIERLMANKVDYTKILKDTSVLAGIQFIENFKTLQNPYEGHYLHYETEIHESLVNISLKRGELLIPTNQNARNFIINALEAETEDSYFAWNFMDSYLQQKEYYSAYVFEDLAANILDEDPELKQQFENAKQSDPLLAENGSLQLKWIYDHSQHKEQSLSRLPVYKIYY